MEKAKIDAIYKWADKKRNKYNYEYQNSGSPSALKTYERYDDICEICGAAERQSKDEDELRMRMGRNQRAVMEQFDDMMRVSRGKTFTAEEVKTWMGKMML